jgi:hypothetical protein
VNYRIADVSVVRYPVLRVTFNDGLSGEYDLSDMIENGPALARLRDQSLFARVEVDPQGRSFGWNLDDLGNEIDFCPDAVRIAIEEQKVAELAVRHRVSRSAAE